jgi:GNAT superfamily N-acetyltransferase
LELLVRGWTHFVQPGLFVLVKTCWDGCGYKRATHAPLVFRPVTEDDADLLYTWRNDPRSREASWQTEPIDRTHHQHWLNAVLQLVQAPATFWIAEVGGVPLGSLRVTPTMPPEVSVMVAPEHRGNGLAAAMLSLAPIPPGTIGLIKGVNLASLNAFHEAGWKVRSVVYEKC